MEGERRILRTMDGEEAEEEEEEEECKKEAEVLVVEEEYKDETNQEVDMNTGAPQRNKRKMDEEEEIVKIDLKWDLKAEILMGQKAKFLSIGVHNPLKRASLTQRGRGTHITVQREGEGVREADMKQACARLNNELRSVRELVIRKGRSWPEGIATIEGRVAEIVENIRSSHGGAGSVSRKEIHVKLSDN